MGHAVPMLHGAPASTRMDSLVQFLGIVASGLSALAAFLAIRATIKIAEMQKTLSQRQLIIPLWDHMSSLNDIDPASPVVPHVLQAVNTLELVALCCEGGMVDDQVIKRTFRDPFMQLYDAIERCPEMSTIRKSGQDILRENRAAMQFYEVLKKEHLERDKMNKI